jgi:hypothetical protein
MRSMSGRDFSFPFAAGISSEAARVADGSLGVGGRRHRIAE